MVEIPDSEIDELFEGQSGDEDILNQLQENVLELPDGWTVEKYSEWLKGSMPEGWVEDQWQHYSREKLAIIEEQQLL